MHRAALIGGLVCALAAPARGQEADSERRTSASVRVYADDDHMTVISPRAGARTSLGERLELDVSAAADVVSGASVDVVSEASPSAIDETRLEGALGVTVRPRPTLSGRARAMVSREPDYLSIGVELGGAVELGQRNTVVDLAFVGSRDTVGAVTRDDFEESRNRQRLTATLTQVLDRATYVDLVVGLSRDAGYLESPYRTVPVVDPASPLVMRVDERVPGLRRAIAGRARVRRALHRQWFGHLWYRYYRDSWSIDSHTAGAAVLVAPAPRLRLGAQVRGYVQSAADFYRDGYELEDGEVPALRTRERRLGRMRSGQLALTADLGLRHHQPEGPRLVTALGLWRFQWPDFSAQNARNAVSLTVGIDTPF